MSFLSRLLKRYHRHHFVQVGDVTHVSKYSSMRYPAVTAKIFRCKCGAERRELTSAGLQQLNWGENKHKLLGHDVRFYGI